MDLSIPRLAGDSETHFGASFVGLVFALRLRRPRKLGRPGISEGPEKDAPMKKALYGFPQLQ